MIAEPFEKLVSTNGSSIRLIVNADDFGYFRCVSEGIIDCAKNHVVTATGIMANSRHFDEFVRRIQELPEIDLGIHLNVTFGRPLSAGFSHKLDSNHGNFPGKFWLARAIVTNSVTLTDIVEEWRAQITRCVEARMNIRFLNSHEHIHMLPVLYNHSFRLAKEFGIPHVRRSKPEWSRTSITKGFARNLSLQITALSNNPTCQKYPGLPLLGLKDSGKLGVAYMKRVLPRLNPGCCYELMCHPGFLDPDEIVDPGLRTYHDWDGELNLLKSEELADLIDDLGIELVGYRAI